MQIHPNEVHIWSAELDLTKAREKTLLSLLNEQEVERAKRFHFPAHQTRFIAARGYLRQILSKYTGKDPNVIEIAYSEYNKPHLAASTLPALQFNLAHSNDMAVYAITLNHHIGVDIEKVQNKYNPGVAMRYFSLAENEALDELVPEKRTIAFYRIWSRKEAVLKAIGKGLSYPLKSFSVSCQSVDERLELEGSSWSLVPLTIHTDYEASLATDQAIDSLKYFKI